MHRNYHEGCCTQIEEDDQPLSQVFRIGAHNGVQSEEEGRKGQQHRITSSPSNIKKVVGNLERRVASVEASMTGVVGGISSILSELRALKNQFAKHRRWPASENISAMPVARQVVAKCASLEQKPCIARQPVRDDNAGRESLSNSPKPSLPQSDLHRGASFSDPLEVEDDESSQSASSKGGGLEGGATAPAQQSLAARVHANPRIKVVPLPARLAVARPPTVPGISDADPTGEPAPKEARYKDQAEHEDVHDFGRTSEPQYKGPVLKPRKNSVRSRYPC